MGMAKYAKKSNGQAPVRSYVGSIPDESFVAAYPALSEYLTLEEWEPGKPRKTSTIVWFVEQGLLKACINDRDASQVAFVSAESLTGLWEALEEGLAMNSLDWRFSKGGKK
jgi:hypothetical protein